MWTIVNPTLIHRKRQRSSQSILPRDRSAARPFSHSNSLTNSPTLPTLTLSYNSSHLFRTSTHLTLTLTPTLTLQQALKGSRAKNWIKVQIEVPAAAAEGEEEAVGHDVTAGDTASDNNAGDGGDVDWLMTDGGDGTDGIFGGGDSVGSGGKRQRQQHKQNRRIKASTAISVMDPSQISQSNSAAASPSQTHQQNHRHRHRRLKASLYGKFNRAGGGNDHALRLMITLLLHSINTHCHLVLLTRPTNTPYYYTINTNILSTHHVYTRSILHYGHSSLPPPFTQTHTEHPLLTHPHHTTPHLLHRSAVHYLQSKHLIDLSNVTHPLDTPHHPHH